MYRGGVTFLQIKRLTGRQAAIGPGSASIIPGGLADGAERGAGRLAGMGVQGEPPTIPLPVIGAAAGAGAGFTRAGALAVGVPALPDVSEVLDDAFGARRG